MSSLSIFSGITDQEKEHMFHCFSPVTKVFFEGETIMSYAHEIDKVGILLSGRAHLSCIDYEGRHSILEQLEKNDIFGEVFTLPLEDFQYFVAADSACDVLFIDYAHIVKRCERACLHHSLLVQNMLRLMADKAQDLSQRIDVLSRRSIREKLLCYFRQLAEKEGSGTFTLPFSLSTLADYIATDRSAMMRELKRLREEGVLRSDGRRFTLCS